MLSAQKNSAGVRCLVVLLLFWAGTLSSFAQSFSFPRLRLGAADGITNRVFTAGDRIVPEANVPSGTWYRYTVRNAEDEIIHTSAGCVPADLLASTDNSYLVQPTDAPTTNGTYQFILEQFANGDCLGAPLNAATQQFYVVAGVAYTSSSLVARTNRFTTAQTAFFRVDGLPPLTTNWNVRWLRPGGALACQNTSGSDRPDTLANGRLTTNYLSFPPSGTVAGAWNNPASYETLCPSFSTADQGEWKLSLAQGAHSVVVPAFLLSNDCVAVTLSPPGRTNCLNTAATFTAQTNGIGPFTMVWRKDGALIPGVTGLTLNIPAVTTSTAGVYSVEVTGPCGTATNNSTLVVNVPIAAQPLFSQTVCSNSAVTFFAPTNGSGPFTFQWRKGTTNLVNQNSPTLTFNNVLLSHAGNYNVIIGGPCNTVTNSGTLTVVPGPTLTPLTNLVRYVGTMASFSTTAGGGVGPRTFTWRKDGVLLAGQTNRILMLTNLNVADSGTYSVTVSLTNGCSVTESATLLVAYCFQSLDVMLVIDRSESMSFNGGIPYRDAKTASTNFVRNLILGTNADSAGVASYNRTSTLDRSLTNNITVLEQSIHNLPAADGGTCISCGLVTGQMELTSLRRREGALPVIVVLTDGVPKAQDGDSVSNVLYHAQMAKEAGTRIFTLGLNDGSGTNVDRGLMASMASSTNDSFYAADSSELTAIFDQISAILCRGPNRIEGPAPSNAVVCAGQNVQFDVSATGCAVFTFEWWHNGVPLPGQTNSFLQLLNVSATNSGLYSVVVSSFCGTITNSANLVVMSPAQILLGPQSQVRCAGTEVSFNVAASGTTLTYQWFKGLSVLPGQTNAVLTLTNLTAADAANYMVMISAACGFPVTTTAALAVNTPPTIAPMANVTACPGESVTLQSVASGTGPLTYLWRKDGVQVGGNTTQLSLGAAQSSIAGLYTVEVTGACGTSTSVVSVVVLTNVTLQTLADQTVCAGESVTFSAGVGGTGPFTFLWRHNGVVLAGETNAALLLPVVATNHAGVYSVQVSGACGVVSNAVGLTVREPTVATALSHVTVCEGGAAQFATIASGTGPFTFVWRRDGNVLAGETNATLLLSSLALSNAGVYSVEVSGACGTVTNAASLQVQALTTATPLQDAVRCAGESVTFSTDVSGAGPFVFVWRKGGELITGATNASLILSNLSSADAALYQVEVSGACNAMTNSANLSVLALTAATVPSGTNICAGEAAVFITEAQGTGPFSFQWRRNGALIEGATNGTLTILNASVADGGPYTVEVSGACNTVTNAATLVVRPLVAVAPMADRVVCAGVSARFVPEISGEGPFTFAWRKDDDIIPGATNSTLFLPVVNTNDSGLYTVEVIGACNTVRSSTSLTVLEPTSATALVPLTVCAGDAASFTTVPAGTGPFSFVWRFNGELIPDATNAALHLGAAFATNAGTYSVEVNGTCGSVTNIAFLTVNQLTALAAMTNAVRCVGDSIVLGAPVSGTGPFLFTWRKDGTLLMGETNGSLTLASVTTNETGVYTFEVQGACNVVSNDVTLEVRTLTSATPLLPLTVCVSSAATFHTEAVGTGPFTFQWRKNGVELVGETNSSLALTAVTTNDAADYAVEVAGACNSVTNSAALVVQELTTATLLTDAIQCVGESATFATSISGTGPFSILWRKDGHELTGETNAFLALASLATNDAGVYSVEIVGACNAATQSAVLVVNELVTASPLTNLVRCIDEPASFSTTIGGTGPFSILWRKDGEQLAGETNLALSVPVASTNDAGVYSVEVTGACGTVTNVALLAVIAPVNILAMTDQTVCAGETITLAVASGGEATFVWRKDGVVLTNTAEGALTLSKVSGADSAIYSAEIQTPCGSFTNSTRLAVVEPPSGLINQAVCVGESVTFSTIVSTNDTFTFTWRKDGELLAGETNHMLTLSGLTTNLSGIYAVEVTGQCGSFTNSATLTVLTEVRLSSMPDQSHCAGSDVTFASAVAGSGPFTYLWRRNGEVMPGETNAVLTLTNVQPGDSAWYSIEVTGACSADRSSAWLEVSTAPVIASLTNTFGCIGEPLSLTPIISGVGQFTNVWRFNGQVLAGETNGVLDLGVVTNGAGGVYTLEVLGACGSATNSITLDVRTNVVLAALADQSVCPGVPVSFTAIVTGSGPFEFVWRKDGAVLSNQTSSVLAFASPNVSDSGVYSVEVMAPCNSATASATLTVAGLTTATPLSNITACIGQTVSFSTTIGGAAAFSCVWRKNGVVLTNETHSTLTLTNVTGLSAGTYSLEVAGCGSVTNFAQLSVAQPLSANMTPAITACACDDLTLAPAVAGGAAKSFVWRKNGAVLEGETNATLHLPMLNLLSPGTYSVDIAGACNSLSLTTALNVINVTSGAWTNNDGVVTIPQFGIASPYPSTNIVRCAPKSISQLRVSIFGLSHGFPDDIDMVLMAPNGQAIKLMSDVGGGGANALVNVDLTFDDSVTNVLRDAGFIQAGTYRPTDINEGALLQDIFLPPGPPTNFVYATQLSQFFGSNPNGVWKLFVVDDHGQGAGSIKRWMLDFGRSEFVFSDVRLTSPQLLTNGGFQMELHGTANKTYYLEASSDLVNWTIIQTNHLTTPSRLLIDATAPQFNHRFYRASGCRDYP